MLRTARMYERATQWHRRHPVLEAGARAVEIAAEHATPGTDVDATVREHVAVAVRHAGLELDDRQLALLLESAPHAIAMTRRLTRELGAAVEPAAAFRLDA